MQWGLTATVLLAVCLNTLVIATGHAQEANYDEAKVPAFDLPDVLALAAGGRVTSSEVWIEQRRPEVFALLESQMYGRAPGRPEGFHWKVFEENEALDGTAVRKQVTLFFSQDESGPQMDLLLYLPKRDDPCPLFLGLNFDGNHSIADDTAIRLSTGWFRKRAGVEDNRATEASRGTAKSRWPISEIMKRGFGVATAYYGDIDPDFDDGFQNGVHALYYKNGKSPKPSEWGSIATWAWGLSRALDYLIIDAAVDGDRVAVMGHSRLGKTSLWAGATDPRFAMVVSNDSGCGGAALSRRRFGETVQRINTVFPHWFADNFLQYNGREDELPFDQHQLISLIAPRPVLVCSAEADRWADPYGEFLAAKHATPVYRLFGYAGIERDEMPPVNQLIGERVGYHIRPGKHDVKLADWEAYMDFAKANGLSD